MNELFSSRRVILLAGDILVLGLMTLVGFASHGAFSTAGARMLTTFLPVLAAWLLLGPHLGVFDEARAEDSRQLWRPFWAWVLAAPLAACLRGAWLGTPILPVFVAVLAATNALALLLWRGLYLLAAVRMRPVHG
jgi:hypothetical protein